MPKKKLKLMNQTPTNCDSTVDYYTDCGFGMLIQTDINVEVGCEKPLRFILPTTHDTGILVEKHLAMKYMTQELRDRVELFDYVSYHINNSSPDEHADYSNRIRTSTTPESDLVRSIASAYYSPHTMDITNTPIQRVE